MNTTHNGLTMEWRVIRRRLHNAANPFTIIGTLNGICRMECAISSATASSSDRLTKAVIERLEQIAAEDCCKK
jgi:hypothetical protein